MFYEVHTPVSLFDFHSSGVTRHSADGEYVEDSIFHSQSIVVENFKSSPLPTERCMTSLSDYQTIRCRRYSCRIPYDCSIYSEVDVYIGYAVT